MAALTKTPLYDWHVDRRGRMVEFAGWSMPVQYTSIVAEHQATRKAAGVFDISHMGRLSFSGPDAGAFLDHHVTRRVTDMAPHQVRYSLVTNADGGILDDVLIYCQIDADQPPYQMVVNASNCEKIVRWLQEHLATWQHGRGVSVEDHTHRTAMMAVQGPAAIRIMQSLVDIDPAELPYYSARGCQVAGVPGTISRTGYTGEDGVEVITSAEHATAVWSAVLETGEPLGAVPAGLGCRDTLRLEAAMPLYGHELAESINPIQAGLNFAVDLEDRDFVGHDALVRFQGDSALPKRVGLTLSGKRAARQDYAVLAADGVEVGRVTSGTFSPTLGQPIAMAYVRPEFARPQTHVQVDIRGRLEPATVVRLPFYKRPKPGA